MPQPTPDDADLGAAHTLIVRLRREPGSATWRAHLTDVCSGEATVLSIAPDQGDITAPFAGTLAAAIAQLLAFKPVKEF